MGRRSGRVQALETPTTLRLHGYPPPPTSSGTVPSLRQGSLSVFPSVVTKPTLLPTSLSFRGQLPPALPTSPRTGVSKRHQETNREFDEWTLRGVGVTQGSCPDGGVPSRATELGGGPYCHSSTCPLTFDPTPVSPFSGPPIPLTSPIPTPTPDDRRPTSSLGHHGGLRTKRPLSLPWHQ